MKHPTPKLPQYRILGQIGQGQFGQVYCGVHRQTGELVAIKRLDRKAFPTNQFIRELAFLLNLNHPNIVSCSGMKYQKDGRYVITDYCEGGTLRDVMELGGQLDISYRIKLIIDVLKGLAHAHKQKVIHCDLKPENILLTLESNGWRAKITDFGIARLQELQNTNTGRGYTGSPAYMAPERFYGRFSFQSDIYAMGIILYEFLTRKRPFTGLPGELMLAHLNQRVEMPNTIPSQLQKIVLKAMEKLPKRRYERAETMLKELQAALNTTYTSSILPYRYQAPQTSPSPSQLRLLHQTSLTHPIIHLAVQDSYLLLGSTHQLWCQQYGDPQLEEKPSLLWKLGFKETLVFVKLRPQGCFVLTKGKKEHNLAQIPFQSLPNDVVTEDFKIQSWPLQKMTLSIDPQGRWLVMVYRSTMDKASTALKVLKLPTFEAIKSPQWFSYPVHLIIVDHHHGLAFTLYQKGNEYQTRLTLFNRKGWLIKGMTLPFGLYNITPNQAFPDHLLAIALGQPFVAILIQLKPWKITKIALEIEISFIVAYSQGFCLADTQGTIIILDEEGNRLGDCHLSIEGKVTAIALANNTQLLVTTWDQQEGILYHLDFQDIVKETIIGG
ncbi:MAG: serine/threonine-protein kinase [Microcystaceae cyanobacterium]